MKYLTKELFFLLFIFTFSLYFKLWFISLVPQPFKLDQYEYYSFALQMTNRGLYAQTARLYGYPLFLAPILYIFDPISIKPLFPFQAILEATTTVLVYKLSKKLFSKPLVGVIASLLYTVNPYTTAYVGVALSEVMGIFLLTASIYTMILYVHEHKKWALFLSVFCFSYLAQVRPVFLFYSYSLFGVFLIREFIIFRSKLNEKVKLVSGIMIAFLIPSLYTIIGNIVYFGEFSVSSVDKVIPRELYISLYVPGRAPNHIIDGNITYPKEVMNLYNEYSVTPTNKIERQAMGDKYMNLAVSIIKKNPFTFILGRLDKMFNVWEKRVLFYYEENFTALQYFFIYWVNMVVLASAVVGIILFTRNFKHTHVLLEGCIVIGLLLYISIAHSITLAEQRYSLPGYPIVYVFAGYWYYELARIIKKIVEAI